MNHLIQEYQEGYSCIVNAIQGLTEKEFYFRPSETSWNIKEIVVHLTDAELVGIHRMKRVLAEDKPLLTKFDQDLWAKHLRYVNLDHQSYLHLFKSLRESFVQILITLTEQDWNRVGIHEENGHLSFKELLQNYVNHVGNHVDQINRIKEEYGIKLKSLKVK